MIIFELVLLNSAFIVSFLLLLPNHLTLFICACVLLVVFAFIRLRNYQNKTQKVTQSLLYGLRNLHDGDFSISLTAGADNEEQAEAITLFNQVTDKLRLEKQSLYQRELLLDKVVNASDVVTVLVNHRGSIIFSNRAAKHFFNKNSLLGMPWAELLANQLPELIQHNDKSDAIIQLLLSNTSYNSVSQRDSELKTEQSWHLSRHQLRLHGSKHQLILLKPITEVIHKQELQTWKKVIRVINHELNNSIAPISSMCHSGNILAERVAEPQLTRVFATISKRINKLAEFIKSYSQLARLSTPQKQAFDLVKTLEHLQRMYQFTIVSANKCLMYTGDESQIEQLLINLLKNAQQACPDSLSVVTLTMHEAHTSGTAELTITVRDFGCGMPVDVLAKAFLPYYSTKVDGSGIGLSLCREIIEGHQGQISLSNHSEGGLQVIMTLPVLSHSSV